MAKNTNPAGTASTAASTGAYTTQAAEGKADAVAVPVTEPAAKEPDGEESATGKIVTLRHTTGYPVYRRAGIVIGAQPKAYAVTAGQLAILKADAWVEVTEK